MLFHRDLHILTRGGTKVRLYDGTMVRIRAMTFVGMESLEQEFPSWLGRLMAMLEKGVAISPAGVDSQIEGLLADLKIAVPNWRDALVFILRDSNPGAEIDLDWCRTHLHAPDVGRILKAWAEENQLQQLFETLGKKVLARLVKGPAKSDAGS